MGHIQNSDLEYKQPGCQGKRKKNSIKPSPKSVKQDRKRPGSPVPSCTRPAKRVCSAIPCPPSKAPQKRVVLEVHNSDQTDDECVITSTEPVQRPYSYYPVDVTWRRNACTTLGLQYRRSARLTAGGPHVVLTPPDPHGITHITADGNCLFRSFSYIITGSQEQHMAVRRAILNHMVQIAHFLLFHHMPSQYLSIQEYIQHTHMDRDSAWGSDLEILTLCHLLGTCIFSYDTEAKAWYRFSPHDIDRTLNDDVTQRAIYIRHPPNHFDVVCGILPPSHCPEAHNVQ